MLHRSGPYDEEALIDALKGYLPLYGKREKEVCEIPYKDVDAGKVMMAKFMWLAKQWVFVDANEKRKPT